MRHGVQSTHLILVITLSATIIVRLFEFFLFFNEDRLLEKS